MCRTKKKQNDLFLLRQRWPPPRVGCLLLLDRVISSVSLATVIVFPLQIDGEVVTISVMLTYVTHVVYIASRKFLSFLFKQQQ